MKSRNIYKILFYTTIISSGLFFIIYFNFDYIREQYLDYKNNKEAEIDNLTESSIDTNTNTGNTTAIEEIKLTEDESVEKGLKSFFQDIYDLKGYNNNRTSMYYSFIQNQDSSHEDDFLSNFIYSKRDNPEIMERSFDKYNYILYKLISERAYRISNLNKIVDGLIITYDDIYNGYDSIQKPQKLYKIMNSDDKNASQYYNEISHLFSLESLYSLEKFRLSNGSQLSDGDIVWLYSFWARRNEEANQESVIKILREIHDHYEPEY